MPVLEMVRSEVLGNVLQTSSLWVGRAMSPAGRSRADTGALHINEAIANCNIVTTFPQGSGDNS